MKVNTQNKTFVTLTVVHADCPWHCGGFVCRTQLAFSLSFSVLIVSLRTRDTLHSLVVAASGTVHCDTRRQHVITNMTTKVGTVNRFSKNAIFITYNVVFRQYVNGN